MFLYDCCLCFILYYNDTLSVITNIVGYAHTKKFSPSGLFSESISNNIRLSRDTCIDKLRRRHSRGGQICFGHLHDLSNSTSE
jgi:hypothetical protein